MKSRTNTALNVRQSVRQAYVSVLSLFAKLMALAARVLYLGEIGNDLPQEPGQSRYPRGISVSTNSETIPTLGDSLAAICIQALSSIFGMREPPVTRVQLAPPSPALFNL